ncbi:type I toxin-antitoxin system Ibs family toxin [Salmonella enterica]|uniref:Type I toxin-antitoxin system Ibs family toxin n=2 Tax=Salmonella enterica TaxID=28901 RepID=A0A3Z2FVS8_SALDZ|nr:hypothetical protein [Salmonella enterica subsp. diarizonae]EAA8945593.1 type I toxin-antitoxin system Ibs family toxin [Salmonella enterica]EAT5049245.1 type I toxin-antitoxin system Ibs family toxin [Salmonella enterica subsp. enterica]EBE3719254.1 type I toxin-antitoxin system Ibs family toxin [Salmonella enterica subsp. diarizonae serovar 42:l,v:1,5,7]EBH8063222.1 type I toxin-antitoxin system Ibs family toxin [Salmonella bongori]EBH8353478.1 type I toxin-antitoxin system Ibs family tox
MMQQVIILIGLLPISFAAY